MKQKLIWFIFIFLVACGGQAETPPPTDENVLVIPTNTAVAVAVDSTLPPPPTLAPPATATALPTLEATATSEASAEPTPVVLLSPADFSNRNPLTGEVVDDPEILARRPLAIKISNSPPVYVRPQSGLNDADLVFEHTTEGNITRFTAIFYGKDPEKVGPIRSARLIDIELPAMYDAALAFSGASTGVNQRLNASDFRSRILQSYEEGYYRTGEDKPFEHTLYADPTLFWQTLDGKGLNSAPNFNTYMTFSNQAPAGGTATDNVVIDYEWETVEWLYNSAEGHYLRWAGGNPHLDGNTLEQVHAQNIVLVFPIHAFDADICEEIRNDTCAHLSVQVQLWGSGSGIVLRDGQRYDVTWKREGRNDMLTFYDSAGNPFPLQIGNTWVQVVPNWLENPVTFSPQ